MRVTVEKRYHLFRDRINHLVPIGHLDCSVYYGYDRLHRVNKLQGTCGYSIFFVALLGVWPSQRSLRFALISRNR